MCYVLATTITKPFYYYRHDTIATDICRSSTGNGTGLSKYYR